MTTTTKQKAQRAKGSAPLHPLEGNRKLRKLAALYRTQGSNGGTRLAALRAGIEATHGSLPSYLERTREPSRSVLA
ncbi:hypothetical protein [Paraburkholderia sp. 40]|uniref:hypothetical protein n=1 Tax=Paraburkholderia sp. 40 TaxID=2991059 RepID=UPI003D1D17FF